MFNATVFLEDKLNEAEQKTDVPEEFRCYSIESVADKNLPFTDEVLAMVVKYKHSNGEIVFLGPNNPNMGIFGKRIRWAS